MSLETFVRSSHNQAHQPGTASGISLCKFVFLAASLWCLCCGPSTTENANMQVGRDVTPLDALSMLLLRLQNHHPGEMAFAA